MKEFGSPSAKQAAVFCAVPGCDLNSYVHVQELQPAQVVAFVHETSSHEPILVHVDNNHPLSDEEVKEIEDLTGMHLGTLSS